MSARSDLGRCVIGQGPFKSDFGKKIGDWAGKFKRKFGKKTTPRLSIPRAMTMSTLMLRVR